MYKFKTGDRVKVRGLLSNSGIQALVGRQLTIKEISDYKISFEEDSGRYYSPFYYDFEFISSTNQTTMNIKEKFALAFKSEPEKSFRKAGITNGDDFLTSDGQEIFLGWLLQKHGPEFKTEVVDDLLKEEEK